MIANHYSHRLSNLDLRMAACVPPGGNWKDIPDHVPSNRLAQIRLSFAAGEGSRSTYYGRLHPDNPAYTINTYFNRPGNGCFLHYDFAKEQHRTVSQREAARLQSFPDDFHFLGAKLSVNKQIGNAVPPILSLQIAKGFDERGAFIDLFCGAGGLSWGFHQLGWKQIAATDIEKSFLETHQLNFRGKVLHGDITAQGTFDELVATAKAASRNGPMIILGGPPCQGFSTAGNRRSMDDARNHLFKQYAKTLTSLDVEAFVFENVPGLLNMQGGIIFNEVKHTLQGCGYELSVWNLRAEEFGIPQRRTRIFILGVRRKMKVTTPAPITSGRSRATLLTPSRRCWSVKEALDDLPPIDAGEDGSGLEYRDGPSNRFQEFVRGKISATELLDSYEKSGFA
jgi:DNA (cytosine-5)-methyltransferase 1